MIIIEVLMKLKSFFIYALLTSTLKNHNLITSIVIYDLVYMIRIIIAKF